MIECLNMYIVVVLYIYIYNMYIYNYIYIYMYAPNTYSQMVCRNDVSRWGSIEESI